MKKNKLLTVRASPIDLQLANKVADRHQISRSELVRQLIHREAAACGVLPESKKSAPDGSSEHGGKVT